MGLLRTISGRVRSFRDVKGAVTHHGRRVAHQLDDRFNPLLPESLRLDFWKLIQAIFEILKHSCDRLIGAEHLLVEERGNDTTKQKKRDSDTQTLFEVMLGFREAVRGIYQPDNIEEYGFPTVLSRVPFELLRQGDHLVETLGKEGFSFPEALYTDGIDLPKELGLVRQSAADLRVSLDEADGELKLAQAAKVDKDHAEKDWDGLFGWGGRMLTGLFIWAGENELANYMLPSTNRPGRTRRIARQERDDESGGGPAHGDGPDDTTPDDTTPDDTNPDDTTPGAGSPAPGETSG